MKIYLVRHGETDWNVEKRVQGQLDVPLNNVGRDQALKCHTYFIDKEVSCVYSSSLSRAVETAYIIAPNKPIIKYSDLNERNFGVWQGRLWMEVYEENPDLHDVWKEQGASFKPPNGESIDQVCQRVIDSLWRILYKHKLDENILIIGHGGPIKCILGMLQGVSRDKILDFVKQENCAINCISYDGKFVIDFMNYVFPYK